MNVMVKITAFGSYMYNFFYNSIAKLIVKIDFYFCSKTKPS